MCDLLNQQIHKEIPQQEYKNNNLGKESEYLLKWKVKCSLESGLDGVLLRQTHKETFC